MPKLPAKKVPTPFGKVFLPEVSPKDIIPTIPKMDSRQRNALKHAVAMDTASVFGVVPYVGGIVADTINDLHVVELRKLLNPAEFSQYEKYDKLMPNVPALLKTFSKKK